MCVVGTGWGGASYSGVEAVRWVGGPLGARIPSLGRVRVLASRGTTERRPWVRPFSALDLNFSSLNGSSQFGVKVHFENLM